MSQTNINYNSDHHKELPHVVKFSGGRSSGMMLFTLIRKKILKATRGDIVVFNNTSAEHPATYEFVMECKKRCERDYGIPFFITELLTYEDSIGGFYDRVISYKITNDKPFSDKNTDGYHWKGEVFEELLSLKAFVPNQFQSRICTTFMKLLVSKLFIADWVSGRQITPRQGHFQDARQVDLEHLYLKHQNHKGTTPKAIYKKKKEYLLSRPFIREAQEFTKFTKVKKLHRPKVDDGEYCSLIGLRADEERRVANIKKRQEQELEVTNAFTDENENIYLPLCELDITKDKVHKFWKRQKWDLRFPPEEQLSNCVFCFLKGETKIKNLIASDAKRFVPRHKHFRDINNTPADINWWIDIENKYGRDLIREKRQFKKGKFNSDERPFIGFFGTKTTYKALLEHSSRKTNDASDSSYLEHINSLPCEACTD